MSSRPPPKTYRVYRFDLARNEVAADFINAPDDDQAIAMAAAESPWTKCEIWDGRRLVGQIP